MRGAIEATRTWPAEQAWLAVTEVTASAYGVELELLRAPSRGRGPRPPERAREPKKVAVYLTVLLSGADCAAVARQLHLHRDTVWKHCEEVRLWADEDVVEQNLQVLAAAASVKLGLQPARSSDRRPNSRSCDLGKAAA
jgi:hypothetical protein